ncbi:MAG: hypothetical protein ACI9AR_000356 [Flavobacteriaceae bacterium]|jgi:hypothetical protein
MIQVLKDIKQEFPTANHYEKEEGWNLEETAINAMEKFNEKNPSFLWFNGTACGIEKSDDSSSLIKRWYECHTLYKENSGAMKIAMKEYISKFKS